MLRSPPKLLRKAGVSKHEGVHLELGAILRDGRCAASSGWGL